MTNVFKEYVGPRYNCSNDSCSVKLTHYDAGDRAGRCSECGSGWINEHAEINMNPVEWVRASAGSPRVSVTTKSGKTHSLRIKTRRDGSAIESKTGKILAEGRPFRFGAAEMMLVNAWLDPAVEQPPAE